MIPCILAITLAVTPAAITAAPASEWDQVFSRKEGWIGGDAIYSMLLPENEVLWLFADTFIGKVADGQRQPGLKMVNNTLARHKLAAPGFPPEHDSVQFLWSEHPSGKDPKGPAEISPQTEPGAWIKPTAPGREEEWYWVADAICVPTSTGKPRLLIFLWRMAKAGNKGVFDFRVVGTNVAIIDNPEAKWSEWQPEQLDVVHPQTPAADPQSPPDVVWGSELLLERIGKEDYLLIYGYRSGKVGNELLLARVLPEQIHAMNRWEFHSADGWTGKLDEAAPLTTGVPTEYSVSKIDSREGPEWVLIQSELLFGTRIQMRTAPTLIGPWSDPAPVYSIPDIDASKKHFTYAAKAHPELSPPGKLLISYVVNSFDFGEACRNADIYRPRFVWLSGEW